MATLAELRANLKLQIEYELLWRNATDAELDQYLNWAYADIATYSLALVALRSFNLKHNTAGLKKYPETGNRAWEWDFSATGLYVPFHVLWERTEGANTIRYSLRPSVYTRPEVLLQNPERQSRAPSGIDEHASSVPRIRVFPENRLGLSSQPTAHPVEYYYHNGRLWLYPEPTKDATDSYGTLWVFGAFVPENNSHAVFKYLSDSNAVFPLPPVLTGLIPEIAYYYWARGVTDAYALAENKRQIALQTAVLFRQQMLQIGIQGAPFTENSLNIEMLEQLGGRLRNTPSRRSVSQRGRNPEA